MSTFVSIVTISYNAENEIERTICSVVNQNYSSYEYIIVDGASTDGTLSIIEKYKHKITCIISEKDFGIYNAMNKSLEYCKGEWIIFMNAGDMFVNSSVLKDLFTKLYDNSVGVLYGYTCTIRGRMKLAPFVLKKNKVLKMGFCHQSSAIRSSIMKKYHFDEKYKLAADYNLMYKLWLDGVSFLNVGIDIALFDTNGVSSLKQKQLLEEIASFTGLKGSNVYYLHILKLYVKSFIQKIWAKLSVIK